MNGRKVLVVGGAGYIGSHICKALAARGDTPIVFDNLSSGHEHAVQWGPLHRGDIRNAADIDAAFANHKPDAVIHFAACIEVGEGEIEPLRFWDNNVGGVISLLQAMKRANVNTLVFSSTCATYGEPETLPLTESEPQTPVSVYGRTKLAVETLLSDVSKAEDLSYAALRYFNASGASPDGEIGEEHDPESHLIPNALKAAAGLSGRMKLFGTDYPTRDGTCVRDYIHVSDLAVAHLAALDRLLSGNDSFVCNLGSGTGFTVREILDAVERVTGNPVPCDEHPRRPGDAPTLLADTSTAERLLGFKTVRSTPDLVIGDAWAFHRRVWGLDDNT
ncbi:UDP-glucose 4-epimerase GalE [Algimonas arctica]|uniref:UDP-glucose 4-epimerase n=1 Tax=Algimonas arctica TaxID=1479486 RepID=A0A8J3CQD3_9PROT|nr:UDP-glucose 4-epimerase GalE [Algimonas arctica]GHA85455.1 UDP-glucose 4-epimerase GalE [Algimonas arctica]